MPKLEVYPFPRLQNWGSGRWTRPRSHSSRMAEASLELVKDMFSTGHLLTPRPRRVSAPALTSPWKAAHRMTVMNQRSILPDPQLRREPTTASGSFSVGASAWRSRCPTTGAPAPRCSISNASSAAEEKRSCCRPASQRDLVNYELSPGPASPDLAVPASATSPGAAPSEGRAVELRNKAGNAGCGRAHLPMHRACADHAAEMWPVAKATPQTGSWCGCLGDRMLRSHLCKAHRWAHNDPRAGAPWWSEQKLQTGNHEVTCDGTVTKK